MLGKKKVAKNFGKEKLRFGTSKRKKLHFSSFCCNMQMRLKLDIKTLNDRLHNLCEVKYVVMSSEEIVSGLYRGPKKTFLSQNTFLGHSIESIVHGAESFSVFANIEQNDRPLLDTRISLFNQCLRLC